MFLLVVVIQLLVGESPDMADVNETVKLKTASGYDRQRYPYNLSDTELEK